MSRSLAGVFRVLRCKMLDAVLLVVASLIVLGVCHSPLAGAGTSPTPSASAPAVTPVPVNLKLEVAPRPGTSGELTLTMHLTGSSSNGGKSVAFFVVTKEFGKPLNVPIGMVKTSRDGEATINYTPTWNGDEQFLARLTSGSPSARAQTATSRYRVTASGPGPLYATANPLRPFSLLGHVFVGMILTIVALLWLTLIGILVLLARRLPRLAGGKDHLE